MTNKIINDTKLIRLIDREKMSQVEAAKELGVTKQAVNQRLKELRGVQTKALVAKHARELVEQSFDAIGQLTEINQKTLELLEEAEEKPEFALRCISEVRNQVRLAMEIQERIYNQQEAESFMLLVIETLKEVSPDAFKKFKEKIREHKSFRNILKFT